MTPPNDNDGWETRCVSWGGGKGPGTLLLVLPLMRAPGLDCECGWPRAQDVAFLLWYFTEHGSAVEDGEEDEESEGGEDGGEDGEEPELRASVKSIGSFERM